ncbi:MAG TPA: DUF5666 domain-containing protein [Anaerolineae bacterium]|nr:DUF5666 domain-containing protein [Anaerolineae bacterium]
MIRLNKWIMALALALIFVSGAAFAYAAPGNGEGPGRGPGGGGPHGGMMGGGEVTEVGDDSLMIENRDGESITVNVSDDTVIYIVESGEEGSLDDIDEGDTVQVGGPRNDDDEIDADHIALMPDGDRVSGRVTDVDDDTITVENRDDTITINVSNDTVFRNRDETLSLDDVTEGAHIDAYGDLDDDELDADLVLIAPGPQDGPPPQDDGQGPPPNDDGQGPPPNDDGQGPPSGPRPNRNQ